MKSKKSGKNNSSIKIANLLQNQTVLYFVSFLACINVFGFMMAGNMNTVIMFMILAIVTFMFSKNMVIVLLVPLIVVNLFMGGKMAREGLESMSSSGTSSSSSGVSKKSASGNPANSVDNAVSSALASITKPAPSSVVPGKATAAESFEVGRNNKSKDTLGSPIDYSSTLEKAYDNLDKILGADGIKSLTGDTQKLMQQQQKLAETMQGIAPMIENAKSMIETFNGGGGVEKIMGAAGSLQGLMGGAK